MSIESLPFEHRPRNSIANNLDKINELVDWVNLDTHLYASASGERVTADDASSFKGLTVDGRSVQNGTPTPDAPVPVQVVESVNLIDSEKPTQLYIGSGDNTLILLSRVTSYIAKVVRNTVYTVSFKSANRLIISGTGPVIPADGVPARIIVDEGSAPGTTTFNSGENDYLVIHLATNSNVIDPQLEKGSMATPYIPFESIGVVVGDTMVPIDLQGNILASLQDGTHDELHVDSAGHCVLTKRVQRLYFDGSSSSGWNVGGDYASTGGGYWLYSNSQGNTETLATRSYCDKLTVYNTASSSDLSGLTVYGNQARAIRVHPFTPSGQMTVEQLMTWLQSNPLTFYVKYAAPQTIDLGYIDPPAIPSGSVVTISASLTPTIHLEWWVDDGITALVDDLIAYIDYKTEG